MKKIVSLLVALLLIASLFAVTAVAFADETEEPATEQRAEVVFNEEAFRALDSYKNIATVQAATKLFKLDYEWLKNEETVRSIFVGTNYTLDTASEKEFAVTSDSDKVTVESCAPSKDYKDSWVSNALTTSINTESLGWWAFRFVLKDKSGEVLAKSCRIDVYFGDESVPVINDLSSDMNKTQKDGLKAGATYTIKTNLSITDSSSTTVSYVVFKSVNGNWTEEPIYDSTTKVVAEGYEDCITTAGVIKTSNSDVLADNAPAYKIVYTVKDANGYVSNTKDMTIFVNAVDLKKVDSVTVWKIVLITIACLSAVGIVVVLCIKPKEKVAEKTTVADDSNN